MTICDRTKALWSRFMEWLTLDSVDELIILGCLGVAFGIAYVVQGQLGRATLCGLFAVGAWTYAAVLCDRHGP